MKWKVMDNNGNLIKNWGVAGYVSDDYQEDKV